MKFLLVGYRWGLVAKEQKIKTFKALKKAFFNACYYGVYEEIDLLINGRLMSSFNLENDCEYYNILYKQAVATDFIEYA